MTAHEVILASAGTGKTFQLTNTYLRLLCRGVSPDRILATTFTRKAAGEVLDRVLERLAQGAVDDEGAARLGGELGHGCPTVAATYRHLLADLLRNLDRVNIRTLDSLFVRWVQLFGWELGLPAGWSLLDDRADQALRAAAVSDLLEDADRDEFLSLLLQLHGGDYRRAAHRVLLDETEHTYEAFRESESAAAWNWLEAGGRLDDAALAACEQVLQEPEIPLTGAGKPHQGFRKGVVTLQQHAFDRDWKALIKSGLVQAAQPDNSATYYGKEIPQSLRETAHALGMHAAHQLLMQLAHRNTASYQAMERYHRLSEARKQAEKGYRFDDLPRRLVSGGATDLRALAHRLGRSADHLLLDEFQDTSVVQWQALQPLAEPLLVDDSGKTSFFCVGDVKQAIYAWRSGESRLLTSLSERPEVEKRPLDTSYRSSQAVLDAVNLVFGDLAASPLSRVKPELRPAFEAWDRHFHKHTAARTKEGAVRIWRPRDNAPEYTHPTLEIAAALAADHAERHPQESIGILMRTKKPIGRLLQMLRERGIRASGEGGNPLTDSECVLAALSLFHLADHPGDTAAAFHLRHSPFGAHLALDGSEARRQTVSRELRAMIARQGCAALLEQYRPAAAEYDDWNERRYAQLVTLADRHDQSSALRPAEFADFVRRERVEDPSGSQVRIMTIHASKGLQFHTVILPQLDGLFASKPREPWRERPAADGPLTRVSHSAAEDLAAYHEGLAGLRQEVLGRKLEEDLCLLYVAMTRAVHELELVLPHELAKGGYSFGPAALIHERLRAEETRKKDFAELLYEHSIDGDRDESEHAEAAKHEARELRFAPSQRPRQLPRITPSQRERGGRVDPARLFDSAARRARLRGSFLHACLEDVEWLDGVPAFDDWQRHAAKLQLPAAEAEPWVAELQQMAAQPAVAAALSPARYERPTERLEVWRERAYAIRAERDGVPHLLEGTIDRVVLVRDESGGYERAEILDYKSDAAADDAAVRQLVTDYAPQLAAYRDALCAMTGLPPAKVSAALVLLSAGRVEPVPLGQPG